METKPNIPQIHAETWIADDFGNIMVFEASADGTSAWGQAAKAYGYRPGDRGARARAVVAVPDMLAALLDIAEYNGGASCACSDTYVMGRVRDALAKAGYESAK
jgi:hypothetical protein